MSDDLPTPSQLLEDLAAIFPEFRGEWDEGETPATLHEVMLVFTPFFGRSAPSASSARLECLGALINDGIARGGLLENAFSTCLLEHLHQIRAWKALKPFLPDAAKRSSRA